MNPTITGASNDVKAPAPKKMTFFQQIKARWNAETPLFWVKMRKYAIYLGTAALAVWLANSSLNLALAVWLLSVCKYTIAACAATGLMSSITKKGTYV